MSIFSKLLDIVKWGGTNLTGRDISNDIKTLSDDTVKGILRSLGDAGASPSNASGQTLLQRIVDLRDTIKHSAPRVPGTQVHKYISNATANTILYTVPAGKKLYITSAWLHSDNLDTVDHSPTLWIRDAADAAVYYLIQTHQAPGDRDTVVISLPCAIEVPEGYDVVIAGWTAGACHGGFHGGEE